MDHHLATARLIPARAGKTASAGPLEPRPGAHPRSRGENSVSVALPRSSSGSSPLARGKRCGSPLSVAQRLAHPRSRGENQAVEAEPQRCVWLIPARAGKTLVVLKIATMAPAHPRSRGENVSSSNSPASYRGSSPLARGKPGRQPRGGLRLRLIPARAGKTPTRSAHTSGPQAHPRSRGENAGPRHSTCPDLGSSPLARGKQRNSLTIRDAIGLIPARAGKTYRSSSDCRSASAHPRSRGENSLVRSATKDGSGSSPLARGKQVLPGPRSGLPGLIPARAGKTATLARALSCFWAHPRSRGENAWIACR